MVIDGNETEKEAMRQFHLGNRKEGLRIQEEFASRFREEYRKRITVPVQRRADITETAKNALRFTARTRNMCQTV